jgi:hypothetical protein
MSDYRIPPVFGRLTDPFEIAVFDRQQEREEYEKYYEAQHAAEEKAYYRAMEQEMYEMEFAEYWMGLLEENEMITETI